MPVPVPQNAKRVFHGLKHDIWQWEQTLFDGSTTTFESMVREDTVSVIPFLDAQTVLLIYEEQPSQEHPFWEAPGGCVDPEENPEMTARRELLEETGYEAGSILPFRTKRFQGKTRFEEHVFLASRLSDTRKPHLDAGEKIQSHPTPWKEAVALCLRGELRSQTAMLAILAMEFDPEAKKLKEQFLSRHSS